MPNSKNIRFRIRNNNDVQKLQSVNDSGFEVTSDVKLETLTHQEVDSNFAILINYLKSIANEIDSINSLIKALDPETLKNINSKLTEFRELKSNLETLNKKFESHLVDFKTFKNLTTSELAKKLESVKTINGQDITGKGATILNISRTQFTTHLTDIRTPEVGTISILNTKASPTYNELYKGDFLYIESTPDFKVPGTWRCIGIINNSTALYIRLA